MLKFIFNVFLLFSFIASSLCLGHCELFSHLNKTSTGFTQVIDKNSTNIKALDLGQSDYNQIMAQTFDETSANDPVHLCHSLTHHLILLNSYKYSIHLSNINTWGNSPHRIYVSNFIETSSRPPSIV